MVTAQSQISLVGIIYRLCKQSSALSSSWYKAAYIGSKTLDTFPSMVKMLFLQMRHENKREKRRKERYLTTAVLPETEGDNGG